MSQKPLSLAQHFSAPDGYTGHFGWLCGYSANAEFLDNAAERFTRSTRPQRDSHGQIALALFLDPGNQHISIPSAPGVAHLPMRDPKTKPFLLLHAKVALLGFQHAEKNRWLLRLLVSTGNWTIQTLEESLDLVWRIDISSENFDSFGKGCADIKAAWNVFEWLEKYFDASLLKISNATSRSVEDVKQCIARCSAKAEGASRFFDNRNQSLLAQLPGKIKALGKVRRNYLAMGSGFYEKENQGKPPHVPLDIVGSLQKDGLLTTKSLEADLFVSPEACQAIATAADNLRKEHGITIRPAADPQLASGKCVKRSLHAKFLFSAYCSKNSNTCESAWVYLGSGNLTKQGFANKMSARGGNFEAGVVFAPSPLCWKNETTEDYPVVTNLLPMQWDKEISDMSELRSGSDMEERNTAYVAPPLAWLLWHDADGACELRADGGSIPDDVKVFADSDGKTICQRTKTGFEWRHGGQPREVLIRWEEKQEALIPVVDQYGRIAATALTPIDIEEAWWRLADFPMFAEDTEDGENGEFHENESGSEAAWHAATAPNYPIRAMMELIENIAAKQTMIDERDWLFWCDRLEQTLIRAGESAPVKYFRDELELNPLSPLRHPPFRPSFAKNDSTDFGKNYTQSLDRIEQKWKIHELTPLEHSNASTIQGLV